MKPNMQCDSQDIEVKDGTDFICGCDGYQCVTNKANKNHVSIYVSTMMLLLAIIVNV